MGGRKTSIFQAGSYRELGDYWDAHDLGEVWDATREAEVEVGMRSRRWYVSLEPALSRKVSQIARACGVSPGTLVNLWVQEKVGED